jgi:hypothetical protein
MMSFQAQVEFSLRKVADQSLRGLLSGSATAMGSGGGQQRIAELQDQAVEAAVESALHNADKSLALAAR